jgi:hypothetical protein
MKKFAVLTLALSMAVGAAAQSAPPDVPRDHWAHEAVDSLFRLGVLRGYPDGTFKGARPVSRYEMASSLNGLHTLFAAELGDIQQQIRRLEQRLDAPVRTDQPVRYVTLEEFAQLQRQMDQLRPIPGSLTNAPQTVRETQDNMTGLLDRLRSLRADVDEMRRQIRN